MRWDTHQAPDTGSAEARQLGVGGRDPGRGRLLRDAHSSRAERGLVVLRSRKDVCAACQEEGRWPQGWCVWRQRILLGSWNLTEASLWDLEFPWEWRLLHSFSFFFWDGNVCPVRVHCGSRDGPCPESRSHLSQVMPGAHERRALRWACRPGVQNRGAKALRCGIRWMCSAHGMDIDVGGPNGGIWQVSWWAPQKVHPEPMNGILFGKRAFAGKNCNQG